MTQDEIIEMARQAGFPIFGTKVVANDPMQQMLADAVTQHYHDSAIQFAKLVAAHTLMNIDPSKFMSHQEGIEAGRLAEREACAALIERYGTWENTEVICNAIRARGAA
jgi:hypothetical protein